MNEDKQALKFALITRQKDTQRAPPMGLVYIATYLKDRIGLKKSNIKIFDNYYSKNMVEDIIEFGPDLIGFTSMSVDYGVTIEFAKQLRKDFKCPFIIGGVHISTLPESLHPVFDVGVIGEGEETLAELIDVYCRWYHLLPQHIKNVKSIVYWPEGSFRGKDNPKETPRRLPIKDLDILPYPDFSFVDSRFFEPEEIPAMADVGIKGYVLSSRGCPYRCIFCSTARFWGKMRFHSPEYTAGLAKHMADNYGADVLWTLDDLFTVSPTRMRKIREAMIANGSFDKFKGGVFSVRANLVNEKLCQELKKLKVAFVNFGFESGSEKVLNKLKAGSVSVDQNRNAVLLCEKYGITVYGSLMYGSPGETIEDMKLTNQFIDFLKKHGAKNVWSFVTAPYPSTPFWSIALARGTVSNDMDWGKLGCHSPTDALLLDQSIPMDEFVKVFEVGRRKLRSLHVGLIFRFLLKNPKLFIRLLFKEPTHYLKSALTWIIKQ